MGTQNVWVVTDTAVNSIQCPSRTFAEDLCKLLCKKHNISPLTRTLFALRIKGTDIFLTDGSYVDSSTGELELRIRYKVPKLSNLKSLDENAYNYFFQQARNDVYNNNVPEIQYPVHRGELLGLGITDMYRAILEEKVRMAEVMKNYKRYIPNVIIKKHSFFAEKPTRKALKRICSNLSKCDADYIKEKYLQQLTFMAPNYLAEEYKVQWQSGDENIQARLQIAPFHQQEPGLRICNSVKKKWSHVCTIEQLIYLTRKDDSVLEVSRSGTPMYFKFDSDAHMASFLSACDGYYRLMVKWTFNLSKVDLTPSLKALCEMKCHGPVGGNFSYRKLKEKRSSQHGCYIMRQCEYDYDVYYIDVCTKKSDIETYKLEFIGDGYFFNKNRDHPYGSIYELIRCHSEPKGKIYLHECIPPSEYDKSQLLLCREHLKTGIRVNQSELQEILKNSKSPRCLNTKDILAFKGSEVDGSEGITATYKALWQLDDTRKLEVALKTLKSDQMKDHLKDFIELANKWACVQSSAIVRLYGITLSSPTAFVMEYLPYGPLNVYLRNNVTILKIIHLVKIAANLTHALWDLTEAGCVHGYIRCRKLLLSVHQDDRIIVKLSDPSLHTYKEDDCHWIPVEFYSDMSLARTSVSADVWAFATTLWEVFSYGQSPADLNPSHTPKYYKEGNMLERPNACPAEIWQLLKRCWLVEPFMRARPQELMRDINHLLHIMHIPTNLYADDIPALPVNGTVNHINGAISTCVGDTSSVRSQRTDVSSLRSTSEVTDNNHHDGMELVRFEDEVFANKQSNHLGVGAMGSMRMYVQDIVLKDKKFLLTCNELIGSGNYGKVYKGILEEELSETREVAVKCLLPKNPREVQSDINEEINIMKELQHPNIVEILAFSVTVEVLIVMEYLPLGSLNYFLRSSRDKLRTKHLLQYAFDVARAMEHLSAKNIVHRDLATRNILVVNINQVKISDFGLARIVSKESPYVVKTVQYLPFNWYAPESAAKPFVFTTQSDVWSYGVVVWEMFTYGQVEMPVFNSHNPRNRSDCFPDPEDCPPDVLKYLMRDCWKLDPAERPKFLDLAHASNRFKQQYQSY